ncbi:MAG: type VI secretion system baseplate subunit TssF [Holosporales bacterium]|jgi:type VI secretion system protein ImpG|nr:type VI secretion system baseplate subunit TssF [Holosporales bacterium]
MKNFLRYYQDELLFLREKGGAFAKAHQDIASKLDIKNGESTDPQTERIIEAVAFMAAKIQQKIDENSEDLAKYLLSALYPNLINIFPSCSIAKFETNESVSISETVYIPKNTSLFVNSKAGIECIFKTIYPVNLYPINISSIDLVKTSRVIGGVDGWCLEISLMSNSESFEKLKIDNLLFHINSEIQEDAILIYSALFSNPTRTVFLKINDNYIQMNAQDIVQCGFDDKESVCPVPRYSTNVLQLFQELLHFKRKFMFFRILNLDRLLEKFCHAETKNISIVIDIDLSNDRIFQIIKNDSIMIGATPIVNLFPVTSDPFRFDGTKTRYLLLADQAKDKSVEIHSISSLHMIDSITKEDNIVQPYFSLETDSDTNVIHDTFWVHSKENAEIRNLEGSDTYVSLVDTKMNPFDVYDNVVYAKTLCTNRFEPMDVKTFSIMHIESVETAGYSAKLLYKTSSPISFTENSTALWNLVSQLSSNHLSIKQSQNLLLVVKKIIDIFSSDNNVKASEILDNIADIQIKEIVKRFGKDAWRGFVKGIEVSVYTTEDSGAKFSYLFCSVLNRYLSSIITINSFISLKLISTLSGKIVASWPILAKQNRVEQTYSV